MNHFHDVMDILVGFGHFLAERPFASGHHQNSPVSQLTADGPAPAGADRLRPAHDTARAVAGAAERFVHCFGLAGKHIGSGPHVPRNQHRLADAPVASGNGFMARRIGPRRSLAVHAEFFLLSGHGKFLDFGDIVADVIHQPHPQLAGGSAQGLFQNLPRQIHQDLAVGPGVVGPAGHGGQIVLPAPGGQIGTGQLTVGKRDAGLGLVFDHQRQVVVANLIPQAPRPGVNHDDDLAFVQTKNPRRGFIKDFFNGFDFQKMIAGAEGAQLLLSPLQGARRNLLRICAAKASSVFRGFQILRGAVSRFHRPGRPFFQHFFLILAGEFDVAGGTDAGRNAMIQGRRQFL